MSDPLDLDALAALEAAATPGPWSAHQEVDGMLAGKMTSVWAPPASRYAPIRVVSVGQTRPHIRNGEANVAFIAAARNALPALIDRLCTAEDDRDAYRTRIDAVRALCNNAIVSEDEAGRRSSSVSVAKLRAALGGNQ